MAAVIVAAGGLSGPAMSRGWPYLGVYETIVMFVFLSWLSLASLALSRRPS